MGTPLNKKIKNGFVTSLGWINGNIFVSLGEHFLLKNVACYMSTFCRTVWN